MEEKYYNWAFLFKDGSIKHVVDVKWENSSIVTSVGVDSRTSDLLLTADTAKKVQQHWDLVSTDGTLVTVPSAEAYKDWQSYVGDEVGRNKFKHLEEFGGLTIELLENQIETERAEEIASGTPSIVTRKKEPVLDTKGGNLYPIDDIKKAVQESINDEEEELYVFVNKRDPRLSLQLMTSASDFEFITLMDYEDIDESERFTTFDIVNQGFNVDDFWAIPADGKEITVADLINVTKEG